MRTPGRPSVIGGGSSLPTPRSRSSSIANGERAKTPTSSIPAVPAVPSTVTVKYTRPPSRTSGASSSNAAFTPTLNAPVRIESLGYEGILRYLGEIPPKQGIWAGVELSAGFAGKGKNDGSTPDGKRYFECAPMCGVFVGASKLSRATAGLSRPPSVASTAGSETMSGLLSASSSRSGPGIGTGRVTPSARTGRLSLATSTSSNATTSSYSYRPASSSGRVTPSNSLSTSTTSLGPETPAARAGRLRALNAGATPLVKTRSQGAIVEKAVPVPAVPSIPRASSSAGSSIPSSLPSPTTSIASPRRIPSSSQTLHLSSPFNTPKARSLTTPSSGIGLGSPHGVTPRARIPSAVAMPPPPSPGKDPNLKDLTDLQKTTREIQERIRGLTGETVSPPSPSNRAETPSASVDERLERMQSRIAALEYENTRLRDEADDSAKPDHKLRQEINLLTLRLDDASTKALSAHARAEQLQSALDVLQTTSDAHLADIRRINEELKQAQSALETRETELAETKGLYATTRSDLEERTAEIGALKGSVSDVEKRYSDELERDRDMWDVERKELRSQVDELRRAGQETIALYEEKLDEMRLASKGNELSSSVSSLSRSRSSTLANDGDLKKDELSASSIDHSALLEQLTYLQTKTASLTDALEDARHLHQSDLNILQAQLNQSKTQLKAVKGELEERVRAVEMDVTKKEREVEQERRRRGEVEEALRECGEALEEARREVEGLRMGIGGEDSEAKDKSSRDALQSELATSQNDLARATSELKAAKSEISSHKEEIAGLKHLVKELQRLQRDSARDEEGEMSENAVLRRENEMIKEENRMLLREMDGLKEEVKVLEEGLSVLEDEEEGKAKRREAMVNGSSKDGHPMVNGVKSVEASSSSGDEVEELKKEIEVLKKKLGEMDIKAARKAHDLNKEISELEALVETKIYREDELEQEIQRLNEKLRKANSKPHVSEPMSSKHTTSSSIGSASIKSNGVGEISSSESAQDEEPVCEICEKPGHDIFSCDLLREDYGHRDSIDFSSEDATPHIVARCGDGAAEEEPDIWCEECEGHGHRAEECPYAGDVF
ncbi:hypothetical protein J3R30DRAFT_3278235 [Lentinula aciculospora]|uniref:CAP-Gly domain-containing protein n=1 Tax=Lentinula aciculospora TaxID=153920 RepID=A0A9W9AWP6_9AGAR|nr:hypothetical protein J3R30DRAFT_3278235 [Lentinula aciculospora]